MDTNTLNSPRLRGFFLLAAAIFLLVGLYLFAFAESVATLPVHTRQGNPWPWPIGPLALRFVAALLLAGALASYLVARRLDRPTVAAFASVAAIVSALLLLHFIVNIGTVDWSKPLSFAWLAALALGLVGSILLVLRTRRDAVLSVPPL